MVNPSTSESKITAKPGRPQLAFEKKGTRAKQIQVARVSDEMQHDSSMMAAAAGYAAKKTGKRDLAFMLCEMIRSPSRPSKFRRLVEENQTITPYTVEEALALILDLSLSKQQYISVRIGAKARNADVYPSYDKVRQFKSICRPSLESLKFTDTCAKIELQALLDLTATRIIELQEEVITQFSLTTKTVLLDATLICS